MKKLLVLMVLLLPSVVFGTENQLRKVSDGEYTSLSEETKAKLPMLDRTHNICYVVLTLEDGKWQKPIYRGPWFLFTSDERDVVEENIKSAKGLAKSLGNNLFLTYWANFQEISITLY